MLCIVRLLPLPGVRPFVCPSVTFQSCTKTNKDIFKIFSPSGSDPTLVFPYQTWCQYSDGNPPNGGVEWNGYDKMPIFSQISRCISETVILRWAHAARQFVSIEFSFHPYNIKRDCPRGVPRGNKNVVKIAIFGLPHWLKHRITQKLLKIDRYMLRGVWQALNCLSIHTTYCVIVAGASPGETKMWAVVRENGDFVTVVNYTIFAAIIDSFRSN